MKRSCKAVVLSLWLALPAVAVADNMTPAPAAQPAGLPWDQIQAGLAQLAAGDGQAAETSFRQARSADDSGLAGILSDLTEAYLANGRPSAPGTVAPSLRALQLLELANRHFHHRPVPPAVVGDALARIRRLLKPAPPSESPALLRPLLCNLRLLSDDRATDGEPVLELTGTSRDVGPLTRPRPVFAPNPPFTQMARQDRINGTLVVEVIVDSEGCPASAKLLKPLPDRLPDQTLASLRWHAYEPATYDGKAVGLKFILTVHFSVA